MMTLLQRKDVASKTEKLEEAEKVGLASATKVFANRYSDNLSGVECEDVNKTNDLKDKMESLGARIAKEEFSRLMSEAEDERKEHRFKSLVEEAARFAARAVFSMMTSEEKEASGGENVEVYDAERDKIFEEEIFVAGEEAALAEFNEFLRIEINNGNESEKNSVDEEAERLEIASLGKEAALKEYKLLKEELERKIQESRLKAEVEAEAARKLAEEEAKLAEEEKLRAEDEERRKVAAAAALKEIQERLERQKAVAEARRL